MYNKNYSRFCKEPLFQYGYDFFKKKGGDSFLPVGGKYRVGPGDTICIYLWGHPVDILGLQGFYPATVDRQGKIYIPNLGVFYIWGLETEKVKKIIHRAMSRKFKNFELDVTLGKLREFPVYVSGYVNEPGIVLTTGINSILDILSMAGGVAKNGSLRNIVLKRQTKDGNENIKIDLYELFQKGELLNTRVTEGDSIIINSIGKSAGIYGSVKRPAIYEIVPEKETITSLIEISGNILPSTCSTGLKLLRFENNTVKIINGNLKDSHFLSTQLKDGDLLVIEEQYNFIKNEILVEGKVSYPGRYSWINGIRLSDIIKKIGILPDTNIYTAEIRRENSNRLIHFSPDSIVNGKSDIVLKPRDRIHFYPKWIHEPVQVSGEIEGPRIIPYYEKIRLMDVLKLVSLKHPARSLKAEIFKIDKKGSKDNQENHSVTVYLYDLLIKASEESNILLSPGSKILIKKANSSERGKTITVLGEIQKPGIYNYESGLKLHDILKKAGGYTNDAYPQGLILVRNSAKKLQMEQINISMLSMKEYAAKQQNAFSSMGSSGEEKAMIQMMIKQYDQMLDIMNKKSQMAIGRIALDVPGKLEKLKKSPDNIELIDQDYIYIPPKPNYVLVLGNVYNQMSLPYSTGNCLKHYIDQLGGTTRDADSENMYVIKANGKIVSRRQYDSIINFNFEVDWQKKKICFFKDFEDMILEQGDAIVIPAELKVPIMWRSLIKDVTQIMFQSISTLVLAQNL